MSTTLCIICGWVVCMCWMRHVCGTKSNIISMNGVYMSVAIMNSRDNMPLALIVIYFFIYNQTSFPHNNIYAFNNCESGMLNPVVCVCVCVCCLSLPKIEVSSPVVVAATHGGTGVQPQEVVILAILRPLARLIHHTMER